MQLLLFRQLKVIFEKMEIHLKYVLPFSAMYETPTYVCNRSSDLAEKEQYKGFRVKKNLSNCEFFFSYKYHFMDVYRTSS